MAVGWGFLAIAMYISTTQMDLLISFRSATILRMIQYVPIGLVFVPATTVAYVGLPREKSDSVAGLINFVRNIGSSFGTSAVTTLLAQRSQFHQARLTGYTSLADANFSNAVNDAAVKAQNMAGTGIADAHHVGMAQMYQTLLAQASALSYLDVFHLLMWVGAIMFVLSFFLKRNNPGKGGAVVAH
jgi:DHA2 family multidrug resistance protein